MKIEISFFNPTVTFISKLLGWWKPWADLADLHWRCFNMERRRGWRHKPDIVVYISLTNSTLAIKLRWLVYDLQRDISRWPALFDPFGMLMMDVMLLLGLKQLGPIKKYLAYDGSEPVAHTLYVGWRCVAIRFI